MNFILAIPNDAEYLDPRAETGNLNAPMRLKCVDERVQVKPADIEYWGIATYSWELFIPRSEETGRASSAQPIAEDTRIRIDQRTGKFMTV